MWEGPKGFYWQAGKMLISFLDVQTIGLNGLKAPYPQFLPTLMNRWASVRNYGFFLYRTLMKSIGCVKNLMFRTVYSSYGRKFRGGKS